MKNKIYIGLISKSKIVHLTNEIVNLDDSRKTYNKKIISKHTKIGSVLNEIKEYKVEK